jgi:hypothetical protein
MIKAKKELCLVFAFDLLSYIPVQQVQVKILEVDEARKRVQLTMVV